MKKFVPGYKFILAVQEALGLPNFGIKKMVIEAEVPGIVTVYIKGFYDGELPDFTKLVEDVTVDDQCNVLVPPHPLGLEDEERLRKAWDDYTKGFVKKIYPNATSPMTETKAPSED